MRILRVYSLNLHTQDITVVTIVLRLYIISLVLIYLITGSLQILIP